MTEAKRISVCICAYKRPQLLRYLLLKLESQQTEGLFDYSIVIVDNDSAETARQTAEACAQQWKIPISYYVEPEQNIARARNRAIEKSEGDFVAFIDDDEFPNEDWLLKLYKTLCEFQADGVLGPVNPYFETKPPEWVIKGRLCERASFQTGFVIKKPESTRTGNVLLNRKLFDGIIDPFNPEFGKTGGEDVDFFKRMMQKGHIFVWCDEGCVSEIVPPERYKKSYFLKRALLRGVTNSRKVSFLSFDIPKSLLALVLYTPVLPVLFLFRYDLFMKYLIKDCDHIGKLLALCGLKVVRERTF
jgi:succinoglycan biosynthesis protein ExoM